MSEPSAQNKPQNEVGTESRSLMIGDICEIDIKMRWADADSLQHLNNAVYFRYMEEGRISMFYSGKVPHDTGCGPVVVNCACDFNKQITYPATIRVRHRLVRIGRSSMEHEVDLLVIDGEHLDLRAKGRSVLVWMDFEAEKSLPWPPEVLAALATTVNRS